MNSGFFPTTMATLDSIDFQPLWLAPEHLAQTAAFVMRGHRLSQLAVVKNHAVLGFVEWSAVQKAAEGTTLADLIQPFPTTMESSLTLRQAANAFVKDDLHSVPVLKGETFLGVLTSNRLLQEVFRSSDPLTGLSWTDLLREWGIGQLRNGVEVCLVAFDLDQFGKINQAIGHRRADTLLQKLAAYIGSLIEPNTDVLVRVSGDKFMVGTTRPRAELQQLGERVATGAPAVLGEGLAVEPTVTWGLAGGRRTHERNAVHPESNIDDLIALALNNARQRKKSLGAKEPTHAVVASSPQPSPPSGSAIELILADGSSQTSVVARVRWGEKENQCLVRVGESSLGDAAVRAVIGAVQNLVEGTKIEIESATLFSDAGGQYIGSVTGLLEIRGIRHRFAGSHESDNPVDAGALAALNGLNAVLHPHPAS